MSLLDSALTLITLSSLFILGPAVSHAIVSCFNWQNWSRPVQHLAVGICTMLVVSAMILAYGVLWERHPTSVAWYGWVQEITTAGKVPAGLPTESRKPAKR